MERKRLYPCLNAPVSLNHLYFCRIVYDWLKFSINILYESKTSWIMADQQSRQSQADHHGPIQDWTSMTWGYNPVFHWNTEQSARVQVWYWRYMWAAELTAPQYGWADPSKYWCWYQYWTDTTWSVSLEVSLCLQLITRANWWNLTWQRWFCRLLYDVQNKSFKARFFSCEHFYSRSFTQMDTQFCRCWCHRWHHEEVGHRRCIQQTGRFPESLWWFLKRQ